MYWVNGISIRGPQDAAMLGGKQGGGRRKATTEKPPMPKAPKPRTKPAGKPKSGKKAPLGQSKKRSFPTRHDGSGIW